jgi:hypothetical protein
MTSEQILDIAAGDFDVALQLLDLFGNQPSIEKPTADTPEVEHFTSAS